MWLTWPMLGRCSRPILLARGCHRRCSVAFLTNAGMAFPADLAGVVTVGVAPLADAGMVAVGVTNLTDARAASLVNAGMAFLAEPAGVVTIGVASPTDVGLVTVGVTDLADAGALSLAAPVDVVDSPGYNGDVVRWGDRTSPGVWCRARSPIPNDLDGQYVNYVNCNPVGMGCPVPAEGCSGSFGTCLSDPLYPLMDDATYWDGLGWPLIVSQWAGLMAPLMSVFFWSGGKLYM